VPVRSELLWLHKMPTVRFVPGKSLFVPKLVGDEMEFLKIYGQGDLQSLSSGIWGIPTPSLEWEGHERLNGCILRCHRGSAAHDHRSKRQSCPTTGLDFNARQRSTHLSVVVSSDWPFDLGVAFDPSFSRLGHGKGFYDKFLTSYAMLGRKSPLLGNTPSFVVDMILIIF
jgi:5-formyltetrahydrofolate cyclo-ligase